jgi:intein/homing endonuclease
MFDQLSKKEQIIYLAGLFEGEGWFGAYKRGHNTPSAVIEVTMSDLDMVQRFQRYLNLNSNIAKRKLYPNRKQTWKFWLKGYRALHLMEEMLPYLSIRRKEQYYAVVQSIGNGPKNWSSPIFEQTKDETSNV